jgi:hypothetical protein
VEAIWLLQFCANSMSAQPTSPRTLIPRPVRLTRQSRQSYITMMADADFAYSSPILNGPLPGVSRVRSDVAECRISIARVRSSAPDDIGRIFFGIAKTRARVKNGSLFLVLRTVWSMRGDTHCGGRTVSDGGGDCALAAGATFRLARLSAAVSASSRSRMASRSARLAAARHLP